MASGDKNNGAALRKGLVGGSQEMRSRAGKARGIEHHLVVDPIHSAGDRAELDRFAGEGPLMVEIGCGKGRFLADLALARPGHRLVGIEVRRKYCMITLGRLEKAGADNCRVLFGDARSLLGRFFRPESIDALFILFPDPWWKKKHHKKRVLDRAFLPELTPLLKPGGLVLVRSDVPLVVELARELFTELDGFSPAVPDIELPKSDRELACEMVGIPIEQVCYSRSPATGGSA